MQYSETPPVNWQLHKGSRIALMLEVSCGSKTNRDRVVMNNSNPTQLKCVRVSASYRTGILLSWHVYHLLPGAVHAVRSKRWQERRTVREKQLNKQRHQNEKENRASRALTCACPCEQSSCCVPCVSVAHTETIIVNYMEHMSPRGCADTYCDGMACVVTNTHVL